MELNKTVVDFNLLCDLMIEMGGPKAMANVISTLAVEDVPMSDAVIKVGIALGVLWPAYYSGWSEMLTDKE